MDDWRTDDTKLIEVLLRDKLAQPAWWVAEQAGIGPDYAAEALRRMALSMVDSPEGLPYQVLWRQDLSPPGGGDRNPSHLDVYEATEGSSPE